MGPGPSGCHGQAEWRAVFAHSSVWSQAALLPMGTMDKGRPRVEGLSLLAESGAISVVLPCCRSWSFTVVKDCVDPHQPAAVGRPAAGVAESHTLSSKFCLCFHGCTCWVINSYHTSHFTTFPRPLLAVFLALPKTHSPIELHPLP